MKAALAILAIAVIFCLLAIGHVANDYSNFCKQIVEVKANQKTNSALKNEKNATDPSETTNRPDKEGKNKSEECAEEPSETHSFGGVIVKYSDAAIILLTALIAGGTIALFWDGREKARKELRAYVALENIVFPIEKENRGNLLTVPVVQNFLKLHIKNYGRTPASELKIFSATDGANPGPEYPDDKSTVGEQMLHPDQLFKTRVCPKTERPYGTVGWFIYGRLIYRDIYHQWWVTMFCYVHLGKGSFMPHGPYNKEGGPYKKRPY